MKPVVHFLSEETFKANTVVSDNIDTKLLKQTIYDCQEQYVQELLGTVLYERLCVGIDDADLKDEEKELLDGYITKVMCFYVLSELPMVLGFKFYNKNVLKKTAENAETASMSELADLMKYYKNKAEFYEQRTIKFLKEKIKDDKFPEYKEILDLKPKKTGYSCSIVL